MCRELDVAFVKTSTGFSTGGAREEHVKLMRETVGSEMGVKASGAVRDRATTAEDDQRRRHAYRHQLRRRHRFRRSAGGGQLLIVGMP